MSIVSLFFYKVYSLFFCLRYLPFRQALYLPVLIHPCVRIKLHRGSISFHGRLHSSMLVFGFPGTEGQSNCQSLLSIERGGKLVVAEDVQMARGTRVVIGKQGVLQVGRHFWCNGDCFFNCTTKISIGDDNMYGWNISFNTTDGHHVYENGMQKPMEGEIAIGNHVWIASHCHVSKNTYITDDCVVAQNSLVGKRFETPKCLIGGMPAKILKNNFTWSA